MRHLQSIAVALALLAVPACGKKAPAPDAPRNLVLVVMDTCRRDRVGDGGDTPSLAALARESLVFEDCISQSTATGPSHRSIFTGQYVHRHGQTANNDSRESRYTLATVLHDHGFRTAAFVGGSALGERFHFKSGFEVYTDNFDLDKALHTREPGKGHLDAAVAEAEKWIDGVGDQRFFVFVHGYDPHCPYWPREDLRERHAGWYHGFLDPRGKCASTGYEDLLASGGLGPDEWRYINDLYDAGVEEGDEAIGRLVEYLRGKGLLEDTLVVFTSDHGESLGERGDLGHGALWEEQMRVPLMMRFPGARHAGRNTDMVQHVDVAPTVYSALGVEAPPGEQGEDLMPRIRESAPPLGERMRITQVKNEEAVRFDDRWKLALTRTPAGVTDQALFDLVDDPGETRNLYGTPDGRARFNELFARYEAFRAETQVEDRYWLKGAQLDAMTDDDRKALEALGYAGGGVK